MSFIIKNYNKEFLLVISSLIAFGLIGFIDDTLKKIHKKNEGLNFKRKNDFITFCIKYFCHFIHTMILQLVQ